MKKTIFLLLFLWASVVANAQNKSSATSNSHERDSVLRMINNLPSFSMFKDNFFIIGSPVSEMPSKNNSNIKYQISIKQRLTNSVLPFHSTLFFTYSQLAFWDILRDSRPFAELNYNPAIGIDIPILKNNHIAGLASLSIEHESNGRDSIWSRSWNFVSLTYETAFSRNLKIHVKGWIPFSWKSDNPQLMQYMGYGEVKLTYKLSGDNDFIAELKLRKGASWAWKGGITTNIAYRLSPRRNQYIGLQWYYGHSESLIKYDKVVNMVRIGLVMRPKYSLIY